MYSEYFNIIMVIISSAIFLLDQKINAEEFLERIKVIALYFNSLSDTELRVIKNWIKNTVDKEVADSAIEILEAKKEDIEVMVANNAFIIKEMKEEAKEEGREEGKSELLIKMLTKRFNKLPDEYIEKINNLNVEKIEQIGLDIFDLEDVKDLEKYFI